MKLQYNTLQDPFWQTHGYQLPGYDAPTVAAHTQGDPRWLHLGAGNIFRAFLAHAQQVLLNQGDSDRGIIVAEGFDADIITRAYHPFDNMSIFARLKKSGAMDKVVIASIAEALTMHEADFRRLQSIAAHPGLQMITLTITEKGYQIKDKDRNYFPDVAADFHRGTDYPQSYMGKIVALLLARYRAGGQPVAVVSMDNMSHNGEKLRHVILKFARNWQENGHVEHAFVEWLASGKVAFPWTMIDKITPRPDDAVAAVLRADGLEAMDAVVTAKNTYVAPFVNAEELEY
ncbi:MAG: mannitol dehydrogenase family protein, partial [Cardiobacteriaceae bacterium]|nr:mannitol dehydrogenase family protein [Cardiobacteriaceae bacterium]